MATGLDNLKIYLLAEDLEIRVYKITKYFPKDERFRSIDQLRRSSASVCNNIAEGYNKHTKNQKIHFMAIAKGEAEETKRGIIRSSKKGFICKELAYEMAEQYTDLLKAISGFIRFLRNT